MNGTAWIRCACVLGLLASACSGTRSQNAPPPTEAASSSASASATVAVEPTDAGTVTLTTSGCTFDRAGDPIPAGPVSFAVSNETRHLGAVNVALLDGASFQQFAQHVDKEIRLAKAGKPGLGHPSFAVPLFDVLVEASGSATLVGTLDPGMFVMACAREYEEVGELRPSGALGPVRVGG